MKKDYFKPAMRVVEMKQRRILCASDLSVKSTSTNLEGEDAFIFENQGSSGNGR